MIGWLWAIATLVGLAGIAANVVFWHVTERSWVLGETDAHVAQALVLAAPHLTLAFVASLQRRPMLAATRACFGGASVTGVLATAALLAWQFRAGYSHWQHPRPGEDGLGVGLVMCSSPLVVCIAMVAGGAAWRAVRSQRQVQPPDSGADDHDAGGDQEQREHDPAQP